MTGEFLHLVRFEVRRFFSMLVDFSAFHEC